MASQESSLSNSTCIPAPINDRALEFISDHLTIWVDQYIGEENTYRDLKGKFEDQVQVLKSNPNEAEIDDESMLCADPVLLEKLSADFYCLKYFSKIDTALNFIRNHPEKTIFFISSGTIGEKIVPELVHLSNVEYIFIFCGNISAHAGWAADYVDRISNFFEHQNDLLERLTHDIGKYLENKGDQYEKDDARWQAKNCYAWAKKLYLRNLQANCWGSQKSVDNIDKKIQNVEGGAESTS